MDKERVKEKLKQNPSITMREWNDEFSPPRSETISKEFESWNSAKREAGLSEDDFKNKSKKWSNEELIEILREHPDLTRREWDSEVSPPDSSTLIDRFGSWNSAKREAGLSEDHICKKGPKGWTCEEIKEVLKENPEMNRREWEEENMVPALSTIRDRFGSWIEARKEAGLEVEVDKPSSEGVTGRIKDVFG